jgi:hypothetical protein
MNISPYPNNNSSSLVSPVTDDNIEMESTIPKVEPVITTEDEDDNWNGLPLS